MRAHLAIVLFAASACATACSATGQGVEALESAPRRADHRFCGWLHGSADDPAFTDQAYGTFAAHAEEFDAVHPAWWRVDSPTSFANHRDGRDAPFEGFHDPRVLSRTTPGGGRTRLIPMIGASNRPDYLYVHGMINDPELCRRHVEALVALATQNPYDGLDLDYEHIDPVHLGADLGPGQTAATEMLAYSEFVALAARAMHAAGKTLSVAVPVVADEDDVVFDYDAISREVDAVHVMAYDYHYEGGTHVGPISPLGWVDAELDQIHAVDGGQRAGMFLVGLPNYGLIGPEVDPGGYGFVRVCEPSASCLGLLQGGYDETTAHMSRCTIPAKRSYAAGRAPNAALPGGDRLFFEDLGSLDEKLAAAAERGMGGVTYWAVGGEPGGDAFFDVIEQRFPRRGP
jgi:chitinase